MSSKTGHMSSIDFGATDSFEKMSQDIKKTCPGHILCQKMFTQFFQRKGWAIANKVHGDNTNQLVTNIPWNILFAFDKSLLDYSFCTLFEYQEETYFCFVQRKTDNDEQLNQYRWFPLQCKLVFENNEHQCILGAFMKMCCEVLVPSWQDTLMKFIKNCTRHHTRESEMSKMLEDSRCGLLKKEQYYVDDSSDARSWIMGHAYTKHF